MIKYLGFFTLPVFFAACASTPPAEKPIPTPRENVSIESKQVAAGAGTPHVTEVKFKKNSSALSVADQKKIEKAIKQAEKTIHLDEVTIVTWSDSELPAENQEKLSDEEVKLADDRAKALENFVKKNRKPSIEIVNMAKRSGKLEKFLKTDDARIQQAYEVVGVAHTDSKEKTELKAGKGVLILSGKSK